MNDIRYDVVIAGGGPAGATAANLLARAGRSVFVFEGARFPRFKIGESLLPADLPIFARLGIDLTALGFQRKSGAVFIDEARGKCRRFVFAEGLPGTQQHAYQVDRARFDHAMLELARAQGAAVEYEVLAEDLEIDDEEVRVRTNVGGVRGRYLVDATGQRAWLGRRARTIEPYRDFGRAALFQRYTGLCGEARRELETTGDILVFMVEDGWIWTIPLGGGDLSIGLVLRTTKVAPERLVENIAASPLLSRLTQGCAASEIGTIGNFSYRNTQAQGARYCCVGDARAFLDPVFSSGVTLALFGAEHMVKLLLPALERGDEANPTLMDPLSDHMKTAYDVFERFIRRFYQSNMVDNLFFAPDPEPEFLRGIVSVLAADLWRDDNAFQRMLLASRRHA